MPYQCACGATSQGRKAQSCIARCVRAAKSTASGLLSISQTFFGTKYLVESHIREVVGALDFVRTAKDVSPEEKRAFFRAVNKNYGSSALCLSGGAFFGYYQ